MSTALQLFQACHRQLYHEAVIAHKLLVAYHSLASTIKDNHAVAGAQGTVMIPHHRYAGTHVVLAQTFVMQLHHHARHNVHQGNQRVDRHAAVLQTLAKMAIA